MNTDNRIRGRFARMAVCVNLDKPLVSQVLINGKIQKIKYKFLPMVCFHYVRYRHVKEVCPFKVLEPTSGRTMPSLESSLEAVNMVDDETGEKSNSKVLLRESMTYLGEVISSQAMEALGLGDPNLKIGQ
ncbi:hypothetical protein Goari_014631 [Gossypium aridum]|uniref:Zinc knuckle CX2CX4HX4C domain-containing protein n=1 Tax=Gossypium aridum TaxID=34290 RepID=A0A7J8XID5_GOSAI|nr:hypothetical protein [Gossypium aridum]